MVLVENIIREARSVVDLLIICFPFLYASRLGAEARKKMRNSIIMWVK